MNLDEFKRLTEGAAALSDDGQKKAVDQILNKPSSFLKPSEWSTVQTVAARLKHRVSDVEAKVLGANSTAGKTGRWILGCFDPNYA